ncbi:hypothetical protein VY88_28380 [Azospirillum thiophilum]|uniref:DUF4407 domain-containing protein n=2 Tax=Azospirillum thiophilum TaxID=528244 RepID=A0AAC8W5L4_9PROT|nr:hypothetical protein AL072_31705 [Azospirillum thiophilum]KJR62046.1 hypothetical protein VY88_28380 [Azospirillum thiophilum]
MKFVSELFRELRLLVEQITTLQGGSVSGILAGLLLMVIALALLTVVIAFLRLLFTKIGLKARFKHHDPFEGISFPYAVKGSPLMRAILLLSGTRYEIYLMSPTGDRTRRLLLSIALLFAFLYMFFSYFAFLSVSIQGELFKDGNFLEALPFLIAALFIAMVMVLIDASIIVGSNPDGVQNGQAGAVVPLKAAFLRVAFAMAMGYFASSIVVVYVFRAEAVAAALDNDSRLQRFDNDANRFKSTLDTKAAELAAINGRIKTLEDDERCLSQVLDVERTGFLNGKRAVKGQVICGGYAFTGSPGVGSKYRSMEADRNTVRASIAGEKISRDKIIKSIDETEKLIKPSLDQKNGYISSVKSNFMMLHNALIKRAQQDPLGIGSYFAFMTLLFMMIEMAPLIMKFHVKSRDYDELCKVNETQYRDFFEAKSHLNQPRQEAPSTGGKVSLPDLLGTVFHKLVELFGVASELFQKLLGMAKRLF